MYCCKCVFCGNSWAPPKKTIEKIIKEKIRIRNLEQQEEEERSDEDTDDDKQNLKKKAAKGANKINSIKDEIEQLSRSKHLQDNKEKIMR